MSELYIGLMSGTSADGVDAALVDFSKTLPQVIATHYLPYTETLRQKIHDLCRPGEDEIKRLGELDRSLGEIFAETANELLKKQGLSSKHIKAIGSHGQTIRHHPNPPHSFTMQIGDPNIIATQTDITTVADFRRRDMAAGGQGAPLVPAFHQAILGSEKNHRIIVNIGGIANVSLLTANQCNPTLGFDTGPGNVLLDSWMQLHQNAAQDKEGAWASKGFLQPVLLEKLLSDPYFQLPPPKSSGREYFNLSWLQKQLQELDGNYSPADIQATLTELTAASIVSAIKPYFSQGEILVCGGGANNTFLMSRLESQAAPHFSLHSTAAYGINPDYMEAMAFAWLARQTLNRKPGNLPQVTGAAKPCILGGIYYST